jgi:hypothetical protein
MVSDASTKLLPLDIDAPALSCNLSSSQSCYPSFYPGHDAPHLVRQHDDRSASLLRLLSQADNSSLLCPSDTSGRPGGRKRSICRSVRSFVESHQVPCVLLLTVSVSVSSTRDMGL